MKEGKSYVEIKIDYTRNNMLPNTPEQDESPLARITQGIWCKT